MSATDWEAIERDYRAGVLSVREIARQHDVSDTAIRKRARDGAWERDLAERVQQQARAKLARAAATEARLGMQTTDPATEREIVTQAAAVVVDVVRQHRRQLAQSRSLADMLMHQLAEAVATRDELEATIEAEEDNPARRANMLKAVSLPAHAAVLRDLATALNRLIPLERQAFNVDSLPEQDNPVEADARLVTDYAALRRTLIDAKKAASG